MVTSEGGGRLLGFKGWVWRGRNCACGGIVPWRWEVAIHLALLVDAEMEVPPCVWVLLLTRL